MARNVTPLTSLEQLKKEAKRWLKALRANVAEAQARLRRVLKQPPATPTLRDVQHALAIEHGMPGWTALKDRLSFGAPIRHYETVAVALVTAYRTGEPEAMRIVWDYFGHGRHWDAMRRYVRLDLGKAEQPDGPDDEITSDEARWLVARAQQFENWAALEAYAASVPRGRSSVANKAVGMYTVTSTGERTGEVLSRDWEEVLATLWERRLPGLHASGQMTDALLERFTRLDHLTSLDLDGSRSLTDDGLRYLARLPRLQRLNLMGCTSLTDRGLEVLQHLPALETVELNWTRTTDAGVAHLAACPALKRVDLSGTPSGDGAIRALAGKVHLHDFRSGHGVTDAGLAALLDLPVFKDWQGGEERMWLTGAEAGPNYLMLRGPFSNAGFAQLRGLTGLFALNVDSNQLAITGAALAPLTDLPHLRWLAFDATDESMPYIAALPHLRFLLCQDTTAGDDGFAALGRSQSIEYIWGRRCHNLRRRGFLALAAMPALRSLSVSCLNVDDAGLAALPQFPSLRELMPMDVPDDGYRHIGKCAALDSLVLMYCRDTGDVATSHLTGLTQLTKYFASYNRITDRTPALLSRIESLEEITFDTCAGLSDVGVAALARLPRLRKLRVSGMPRVTAGVAQAFRREVEVSHAV